MRAIDGDALREQLQNRAYDDWNQGVSASLADIYREVADMVFDMPTIEAQPRKGEWIVVHDPVFADTYYCSVCKKEPNATDTGWVLSDFCPNCGADMRGEEE